MASTTSTPSTGPELLTERSIGGILVHLLSLFTGIIGDGIIYLISNNEFTRANARNALNWHVSVLALTIIAILVFIPGADELTIGGEVMEWSLLPSPLGSVFTFIGILLLLLVMLTWLLTLIFALIATIKAISGTAWKYPLAREFVERYT
jgi:hypothetical protein